MTHHSTTDTEPVPTVDTDPDRAAVADLVPPRRAWAETLLRAAVCAGLVSLVLAAAALVRVAEPPAPPVAVAEAPVVTATDASRTVGPGRVASGRTPVDRIDAAWAASVAAATGIPTRAVVAYASADLTIDAEQPGCGIGWNTLAGIGAVESSHGFHADSLLGEDGYARPPIRGVALDGNGVAAIADTDDGALDGDAVWDRAVGPMQFIPATWARWGADGNGDGTADPNQLDDAALAAARYLCASGPMSGVDGWRAAVFSYNHSDTYVDKVAGLANSYAAAG